MVEIAPTTIKMMQKHDSAIVVQKYRSTCFCKYNYSVIIPVSVTFDILITFIAQFHARVISHFQLRIHCAEEKMLNFSP